MYDVVGLDNHGNSQNLVSNQHVNFDNNNDIVIDNPLSYEVLDELNILLRKSTR